jgi:hypothetical protein
MTILIKNIYFVEFTGSCGKCEFQCRNGRCVHLAARCDGLFHCADGSDEWAKACANLTLSPDCVWTGEANITTDIILVAQRYNDCGQMIKNKFKLGHNKGLITN